MRYHFRCRMCDAIASSNDPEARVCTTCLPHVCQECKADPNRVCATCRRVHVCGVCRAPAIEERGDNHQPWCEAEYKQKNKVYDLRRMAEYEHVSEVLREHVADARIAFDARWPPYRLTAEACSDAYMGHREMSLVHLHETVERVQAWRDFCRGGVERPGWVYPDGHLPLSPQHLVAILNGGRST